MQSINGKDAWARVSRVVAATVLGLSCIGVAAFAHAEEKDDANNGLKHRVVALEDQVANLNSLTYPVQVTVDCSLGQSISSVLTDHQLESGPLTIQVSGTCNDTFTIARSNVTIQGQGSAQINIPAATVFGVTVTANVSHVEIRDITVIGDRTITAGILATKGAHLVLRNVTAQNFASGLMALDGGILDVTGSSVRGNAQGLYAGRNGVISTSNTVVESNTIGVLAFKAGAINLTSISPELVTGVGPTIVRGNNFGALVRSGAFLELSDATIQSNLNYGVSVDSGGSLQLFPLGSGNSITGNPVAGVIVNKNGSLVVTAGSNLITANGRGIQCNADAGYVVPAGFTVTGNTSGDIVGCIP